MNATERYWWLLRQIASARGTVASIQQDIDGWSDEMLDIEDAVDHETISMWIEAE